MGGGDWTKQIGGVVEGDAVLVGRVGGGVKETDGVVAGDVMLIAAVERVGGGGG